MRVLAIATVIVGATAGFVYAGGQAAALVGKEAPPLANHDFLGSDGRTQVADFKGEVLVLECWATFSEECKLEAAHMARIAEEYAGKGVTVMAITTEARDTVLRFLTQKSDVPVLYTIGYGAVSRNYPVTQGLPQAFLVGPDGKVVWEGHPGNLISKLLDAEVKKIKMTDEMKAAKAEKSIAYAEALIAKKELLRATALLERVVKEGKTTEAGKKAAERIASLEKDPALKAELDAQKALEKAIGSLETPKDKVKDKERERRASQADAVAEKFKDTAPATVRMAKDWAKIFRVNWEKE